jgi:putative component of membrane protein insertase Oxa1/YidC/SpoIIIJ protein YidD
LLPRWVALCHGRCIYHRSCSNYTVQGLNKKYTP